MGNRCGSVYAGLLVILAGCEHGPPVVIPPAPHPASHPSETISQAAREQLTGKLDLAAVDRLLETLGPEERARFLQSFEDVEQAANGRTDVETRDVTIIIRFGDPERQRLLDQAWAPFWSQLPPAVLADVSHPLPGRSLAAARRQADSLATERKGAKP
jgi:hypothetical protein